MGLSFHLLSFRHSASGCTSSRAPPPRVLVNRIISAGAEWVASQDSLHPEQNATQYAVFRNRFHCIFRTGRCEPAMWRQQRRNRVFITAYQCNCDHFHAFSSPRLFCSFSGAAVGMLFQPIEIPLHASRKSFFQLLEIRANQFGFCVDHQINAGRKASLPLRLTKKVASRFAQSSLATISNDGIPDFSRHGDSDSGSGFRPGKNEDRKVG